MHGFLLVSQTNFFLTPFLHLSLKTKRAVSLCLNMIFVACFVVGCSSQTPTKKPKIANPKVTDAKDDSFSVVTAEQKLALAQLLLTSSTTPPNTLPKASQSLLLLIEASELFLQEQNHTKAL